MSGHTSSQITVQEQHHTTPIQTQSHATQEQILQTRTTATPSDLFSEFKPKKRDKPITLVRQGGANCGCFAAGMAIASLIPKSQVAQLHKSYKSKFKPNEDESDTVWFSNFVAKRIQDTAQKLNLSAIGEMFDAKALMTTINCVLENPNVVGKESVGKYLAKPAPCKSQEQLADLLTRANAMGVRVLIPYYSQASAPALMPDGTKVPAEEMDHAHWSVVSPYPLGSSLVEIRNSTAPPLSLTPASRVYLYEGHTTAIKQQCTIVDVAQSNLCLGDRMNWAPYITSCFAYDAVVQYKKELLKSIQSVIPCLDDAGNDVMWNLFLKELVSGNNAFKLNTIQRLIQQHLRTDDKVTSNLAASIHSFFQTYVKFDSPNNEINNTIHRLKVRQADHPESFTASAIPSWLKNRPYNPDENLLENVNLCGQVILIGKKADVPARAPAAPTPPPPACETE